MAKSNGKKVFVKITNQDIYDEIKTIENQINQFKESNNIQHTEIIKGHVDNKGRIFWALTLAGMALSVAVFGIILHIYK